MVRMWVVPCRFDPVVFDCVAAIRAHFPDDKVCLVDSNSPDQSYMDRLDVDHIITGNAHYSWGAYALAREQLDAESWALIHDGLIVQSHWTPDPFQTVRWFHEAGPLGDQRAFIVGETTRLNIPFHNPYRGVLGPMMFADAEVLDDFERAGLWSIKPTTAVENSCVERIAGIAAEHLGYPITNALQGQMVGFFDQYPADRVVKLHRNRP